MSTFFQTLLSLLNRFSMLTPLQAILCIWLSLAGTACTLWSTETPSPTNIQDTAGTNVAFIVTTDYTTGSFSTISMDNLTANINLGSIHGDSSARFTHNQLIILNRLSQDNVQILDLENGYSTIANHSVGTGTNPSDLLITSDNTAMITRLQASSILFMDLESGEHTDELDLSTIADQDGFAEPAAMFVREDGKVLVTCQRLDQDNWFSPTDYSSLLLIDAEEKSITEEVHLSFTNPNTPIIQDQVTGDLLIGEIGHYGVMDGGVERIDPDTLQSKGIVITEEELGGDLIAMDIDSKGRLYMLVQDSSFMSRMVAINTDNSDKMAKGEGTKDAQAAPPAVEELTEDGLSMTALAVDNMDRVWVADRDPVNPGLRIFTEDGKTELTQAPIDTGLPPQQIIFLNSSQLTADNE